MIAIVNIDPRPRDKGTHLYSLRINQKEIARFEHKREEGLEMCLVKAAIAAGDRFVSVSEVRRVMRCWRGRTNE